MKYEYLLFNIIVISGPLFFGSLKRFYFWGTIKESLISIIIAAIPFIIWDAAVANRHWFFVDEYTLGFRILKLPFEEILFFFSVPFACLFTWEMVKRHSTPSFLNFTIKGNSIFTISIIITSISLLLLFIGKEYTSLAGLFFVASLLYDKIFGASILTSNKFLFFFILITIFTLVFNGYLTWRPIVTYDEIYQLDFRIFTIPIEDFFFGYALLIICTSFYQKMIGNKNNLERDNS